MGCCLLAHACHGGCTGLPAEYTRARKRRGKHVVFSANSRGPRGHCILRGADVDGRVWGMGLWPSATIEVLSGRARSTIEDQHGSRSLLLRLSPPTTVYQRRTAAAMDPGPAILLVASTNASSPTPSNPYPKGTETIRSWRRLAGPPVARLLSKAKLSLPHQPLGCTGVQI